MSAYWDYEVFTDLSTLDASGANAVQYNPGCPMDVKALVFVTTVAQTVADATLTVVVRDRDNGNSTTIGTLVLPFTGSALDQVRRFKLQLPKTTATTSSIDGSTTYASTPGVVEVNPGQEMVITSDGGGDAGTYQVYVEAVKQGFSGDRVSHVIEGTFINA